MKNSNRWIVVVLGIAAVVIVCCVCAVVATGAGLLAYRLGPIRLASTPSISVVTTGNPPAEALTPTPPASSGETAATPTPEAQIDRPTVVPAVAEDDLKILDEAQVPVNNLDDLAERLKGIKNIPVTETPPPRPFQIGAVQKFWAMNNEESKAFQVDATLRYISPHLYFWIENGVQYSPADLQKLGDTFENKIYPTDRKFFGSEWTPGVDDDVHLYILYARNLGSTTGGYFSSYDEYDPKAYPYSNAHEMFLISADNEPLNDPYTYGTLAHEFQHMIHWNRDRNEQSWMNEGFSEVATLLNGLYNSNADQAYISNPDLQLNDWPNVPSAGAHEPNYGASFLFLDYFLNRFGNKVTQDLVGNTQHGLESIDTTLAADHEIDPVTGKTITADDVFADWAATNFLDNPKVGDGRYTYQNFPQAPKAKETKRFSNCPTPQQDITVHQYGVDYLGFTCPGSYTLHFTGSTQVNLLDAQPHSGAYDFWSNMADESDTTLTHSFDFSQVTGPIQLHFSTWYDTEKDFDYVYLEARAAGGDWKILQAPHSTDSNPNGNSYGWAYTGNSGGWIQEAVDLSAYAGKQVDIRFEYVTDSENLGDGFLVDDISIPQINYQTNFEQDSGGWDGAGFVRISNALPQTYRLSLISIGGTTTVQPITLNADQTANIPLKIGGDVREEVLVVSGTTRFTRQETSYQISVTK